jgi:O-antigen/teichoic acid export membrane protein
MATGIGGRGLSMALSLLTVPLTLHYLGPERYGLWLTISSIIALISFSDLGVGNGLLNAVTRSTARGDFEESRRQISSALVLFSLLAAGLGAIFVLIYPTVQWAHLLAASSPQAASEVGPTLAVWLACFLIGLPMSVAAQVRIARQESYVVHATAAAGNLLAVGALLVVIVAHQGLPWLVVAMAGPPLATAAVNGFVLFVRDAPELRPSIQLASFGTGFALLRSGFLFFVLQVSIAVAFTTDTLIVARILGPEAVAQYGVAAKLFLLPTAVVAIALAPLWPAYGEAIARSDIPWVRRTLARSLRAALYVSVPAAVGLVIFGQPIIALWVGGTVTPPMLLLLGLGIWVIQSSVGNAIAMLLNGAHEIRFQAGAAVVMAIVNLALSIWLTYRIGVAGVIWGTVISYGAFVLAPMALYVPGVLRRIEARSTQVHQTGAREP